MGLNVKPHALFQGVYWITLEDGSERLATQNLVRGNSVYGERLISFREKEYRVWDPFRSKLAAAILKGLKAMPIKRNSKILYLGAATGTTVSHVSDMIRGEGHVYCVEFAHRAMRELVTRLCTFRPNLTPILEDARRPEKYKMFVGKVDGTYCDIAQPEQAKILADNVDTLMKDGGWIMLAVKSQSIDVTRKPAELYKQQADILRKRGFELTEIMHLEPYERAHAMILGNLWR